MNVEGLYIYIIAGLWRNLVANKRNGYGFLDCIYLIMINPSYTNGIPNAVSSIAKFLWDNSAMEYDSHPELDTYFDREKYDKIVFLLVDGLGYNYIQRKWSGYIYENTKWHLSSTFPSTTSVAHTAWNTGMAAYNHGMTSWYMYLREIGLQIQSIPFVSCIGGHNLVDHDVDPKILFNFPSLFSQFPDKTAGVLPQQYKWGAYNIWIFEHGNDMYWYDDSNMDDICINIQNSTKKNTYTYAYYHQFDTDSHKYGNWSPEVADLYTQLEQKIQTLRASLDDRTCLMISSDHGFMDQDDEKNLILWDEVLNYLTTPPYGERRYV